MAKDELPKDDETKQETTEPTGANDGKDNEKSKDESWFTDRTEEELKTGYSILKGAMNMDPDAP